MSEEGGDVILFPRVPDGTEAVAPPIEREHRPAYGAACMHRRRVKLDQSAHYMRCSDCDQVLDIFDWLYDYVGRWEQENRAYREAIRQRKDAEERLAVVLRLEANAKSRVRSRGVRLTSGQARALEDGLGALEHVVKWCASLEEPLYGDAVSKRLALLGLREKAMERYREARRTLGDQVNLVERDEPTHDDGPAAA